MRGWLNLRFFNFIAPFFFGQKRCRHKNCQKKRPPLLEGPQGVGKIKDGFLAVTVTA